MPTMLSSEIPYFIGYHGYISLPIFVLCVLFINFINNESSRNISKIVVFSCFIFFNQSINGLLKQICRQPRPKNPINICLNDSKTNPKMGMPSGHAQGVMHALTFLLLSQQDIYISAIGFVVAGLTLLQRYVYRKHTPMQILVGSILGIIIGFGGYYVSNIVKIETTSSPMILFLSFLMVIISFYVDHNNIVERHFISLLKRDD